MGPQRVSHTPIPTVHSVRSVRSARSVHSVRPPAPSPTTPPAAPAPSPAVAPPLHTHFPALPGLPPLSGASMPGAPGAPGTPGILSSDEAARAAAFAGQHDEYHAGRMAWMYDKRLATYEPEIQFRWWHERVLQGVLRAVIAHGGIMAPFHPLGQRPHLPILDIGCGTGAWVMDIGARPELRGVAVIGVDQNPAVIGVGDALLNHEKLGHCSLTCGDARYGLLYPDGAFGLVHLRHLKDDLRDDEWPLVLAEAARLVAPGGWLQCAEIDMPQVTLLGTNPIHYDGFLSLVRWRFSLVGITRREPYIADTLGSFMQDAGLVEIMDRTVSTTISPTPVPAALADPFTLAGSYLQDWLLQYLERQGTEMEAQGIASREDYQEALTRTRFDLGHHLVVLPIRVICARKPRPGEPRRWPGLRSVRQQPLAIPPAAPATPTPTPMPMPMPTPASTAAPATGRRAQSAQSAQSFPAAPSSFYPNSWPFDRHDSLLGY